MKVRGGNVKVFQKRVKGHIQGHVKIYGTVGKALI